MVLDFGYKGSAPRRAKTDKTQRWKQTENGIEGVAANLSDTVPVLDKIDLVDAHKVGENA